MVFLLFCHPLSAESDLGNVFRVRAEEEEYHIPTPHRIV
jgi:hypothetical protein